MHIPAHLRVVLRTVTRIQAFGDQAETVSSSEEHKHATRKNGIPIRYLCLGDAPSGKRRDLLEPLFLLLWNRYDDAVLQGCEDEVERPRAAILTGVF